VYYRKLTAIVCMTCVDGSRDSRCVNARVGAEVFVGGIPMNAAEETVCADCPSSLTVVDVFNALQANYAFISGTEHCIRVANQCVVGVSSYRPLSAFKTWEISDSLTTSGESASTAINPTLNVNFFCTYKIPLD